MLDFDGYVVGNVWKFAVKCFDKVHCMTNSIKEVRVSEGNMLCPGGELLSNIREHHFAIYNAKHSFVYGHDRTMATEVLAAATCLGRPNDFVSTAGNNQVSVFLERRHSRAVGSLKR